MPPKQRRGKRQDNNNFNNQNSDLTVGFVLCHPMESHLNPISTEIPPCLFPLCNAPVLLYVLNWLNVNGIEQIYIICRSIDAKHIQKVINQCKVRMLMDSITILETDEAIYNTPHVLRWIDSKDYQGTIQFTNCVVVPGTLVSNVPLAKILAEHKAREASPPSRDVKPILTTIFTQAASNGYSLVVNEHNMLLHVHQPLYLDIEPLKEFDVLKIEPSMLKGHLTTKVKTGVEDSKIYICSAQSLANFAEGFDWHDMMVDCVPSLIRNQELSNHALFAAFVPNCYSKSIEDLPSYISASLAVIRRWLDPVTIEMNFFAPNETKSLFYDMEDFDFGEEEEEENPAPIRKRTEEDSYDDCTAYRLERDLVYIHDNVFPSLKAKIGHSVVIGNGTKISGECTIMNSVIGNRCTIEPGAEIKNSIIWDNVHIKANTKISHSIIASDVTIGPNVTIEFGCLISFGIDVKINLPPCSRLTGQPYSGDDEDEGFDAKVDNSPKWLREYVQNKRALELTEDDQAYEYTISRPEEELPLLKMWLDMKTNRKFPIDERIIVQQMKEEAHNFKYYEEDEEETDIDDDDVIVLLDKKFQKDAIELLTILFNNQVPLDQITSEYISLKNSNNAEHIDCAAALLTACAMHYNNSIGDGIDFINDLLSQFVQEEDEQEDLLFCWQTYCAKSQNRQAMFIECIRQLLFYNVISERAIELWSSEQDDLSPAQQKLCEQYKN